jgi:glycosyltransferase involved in cell wall biosynthesis
VIGVVHITTALSPSGAGVYEAVRGIAGRLARTREVRVRVLGTAAQPATWGRDCGGWSGLDVTVAEGHGLHGLRSLVRLAGRLPVAGVDVVHAHGVWDGAALAGVALARRAGCPLVISPHGMLEPWAFQHNRAKKFWPWHLWERQALARADVLEAKSDLEASSFPKVGLHNPAAVIPVGLDTPDLPPAERREAGPRTCLFLSRIHPKKGIDMLLHAWANVRPVGWRLVVAGPDDGGYLPPLEALARSLGIAAEVEFLSPQYGDAKWNLLRAADLFVLPSHSENFGIVVPEALAMGVPCIATTGTPWSQLEGQGMGWWVEPTVPAITGAVRDAVSRPPADLAAMGRRGVGYVHDTFSWAAITRQTIDLYNALLPSGSRA